MGLRQSSFMANRPFTIGDRLIVAIKSNYTLNYLPSLIIEQRTSLEPDIYPQYILYTSDLLSP